MSIYSKAELLADVRSYLEKRQTSLGWYLRVCGHEHGTEQHAMDLLRELHQQLEAAEFAEELADEYSEFRPLRRDSLCPAGAAFVSTMPAPSGFPKWDCCENAYTETMNTSEPFNLNRPPHLLAKDLLERIERRNDCKFIGESFSDVEQLIRQLTAAIKQDCCEMHTADHLRIAELEDALRGIQEMADNDLRLGEHPLQTSLHQIEANARATVSRHPA